jgi:hypothetical protein
MILDTDWYRSTAYFTHLSTKQRINQVVLLVVSLLAAKINSDQRTACLAKGCRHFWTLAAFWASIKPIIFCVLYCFSFISFLTLVRSEVCDSDTDRSPFRLKRSVTFKHLFGSHGAVFFLSYTWPVISSLLKVLSMNWRFTLSRLSIQNMSKYFLYFSVIYRDLTVITSRRKL